MAAELAKALGDRATRVPMDGFHLANHVLARLDRRDRKGAPDSFDADGFVALLRRLRRRDEAIVYAPEFVRDLDESLAGTIPVARSTPIVIVEGNYLLLDAAPWNGVAALLDAAWYVETDDAIRLERLAGRHQQFGLSPDAARQWATTQDEANARLIRGTRSRADLVVVMP